MGNVKAILLIPAEGSDLLREGPCGARPPMVVDHMHKHGALCWNPTCGRARHLMREGRSALVLAWAGEPVVEGCDRVDWAQHEGRRSLTPGRIQTANYTPMREDVPEGLWWPFEKAWLACHAGDHMDAWDGSLGTLILLDADGREVSDG